MAGSRVVVVGDVIDDIIVVPGGPVRPDTDTTSTIVRRPGGSASNTAAWLGWLGAPVDLVGRVGAGDLDRHAGALRASGVTPHLSEDPDRVTGTIVIVVDGEHRTMLTDRGANATLSPAAVTDALLDEAACLHLTGYTLFDALEAESFAQLVRRAHERGVMVSLDPGSAGFLVDYGVEQFLADTRGVDILLPNRAEAQLLVGDAMAADESTPTPEECAEALLEHAPTVVLTSGGDGVIVARRGHELQRVAVEPVDAVEPTGAGDAFSAGLLHGLLAGDDVVAATVTGVRTAREAVALSGGRPPLV
ncbi:PfkB family carbohydrate kinase [Chryseoglobus sp. 28M-23]|uniref:carbohydrate kinase family protein n=1 Tax=Chryseoglobus sp. 28M-23 TaxID=2772253 RepID=UPI0017462DDE|nr:PfkB family carbohydrate kinase [Chryseoglobus sp. 28M-23]QOD93802.1 bifunctional hydroxymethylpyrimidine kinase/phosphomethylpyrimidine kinase [Chryseoglobus sp. 28M-23]